MVSQLNKREYELKQQADQEAKEKRAEYAAQENKLAQREANIDRRDSDSVFFTIYNNLLYLFSNIVQ